MPDSKSVLHPGLRGRVAVVTGASRGIGKALAIRLAQYRQLFAMAGRPARPFPSAPSTDRTRGQLPR